MLTLKFLISNKTKQGVVLSYMELLTRLNRANILNYYIAASKSAWYHLIIMHLEIAWDETKLPVLPKITSQL